ncbi:Glutamyl-tRNA synthetase [Mycena venus]|uniref:Glutamyl-tRNA synthetase n=1 Tax=Mycena venus TaxID=2733690 RepID=A0A8H6YDH6_9AGAR|nr:Glutamyl-tRNA synthetase [Mycena venus]
MASLSVSQRNYPFACVALAFSLDIPVNIDDNLIPAVLQIDGSQVNNDSEIAHAIAVKGGLSSDGSLAKISLYNEMVTILSQSSDVHEVVPMFGNLDDHLAFRTFLVGHDISEADYVATPRHRVSSGTTDSHIFTRWLDHLDSLDPFQRATSMLVGAKANSARAKKTAAGFTLGLPNAMYGAVVTRFPPEPSGYLHIGHAKAVMLNKYFATMYGGKLLIRFDDTNPFKEKTEFEETILEDLCLLNAVSDSVSHTSDYFDQLHDYAMQLIQSGKAYADDTDAATPVEHECSCPPKSHGKLSQMAYERFHGIPSLRRDASVEENILRFSQMTRGELGVVGAKWCLRAKISMDNPNKALRDPVIYRCSSTPHHRTGDKWKVYPTYDFACPVVDSLEGKLLVCGLSISGTLGECDTRLNFIYTVLSKRKLQQFVDKGLVTGWDDPRFPTVRGIMRRGLTVEALQQFMLRQGPSQAILSLEWDSLWALNKKIIDPKAPSVAVDVLNGPAEPFTKSLPKHKKNPDVGTKVTTYSNKILVEQVDAASLDVGKEITLMDWGNAIVRSKAFAGDESVSLVTVELHFDGDFKTTKKKITWLAQSSDRPLVEVTLLDYDYIITKKKLEDGDNWENFITPMTEFREEAFGRRECAGSNWGVRQGQDHAIRAQGLLFVRWEEHQWAVGIH